MISSMTAFSRARTRTGQGTLYVTMRSTNHRFLEQRTRVPEELQELTPVIEDIVRKNLGRGSVNTTLTFERAADSALKATIDRKAASRYIRMLAELKKENRKENLHISIDKILELPGVVQQNPIKASGKMAAGCRSVITEAIEKLKQGREKEGQRLERKINSRLKKIQRMHGFISKKSNAILNQNLDRLEQKVSDYLNRKGLSVDPGDLIKEVVVYTDKADISEECDRVESHIIQFRETLAQEKRAGRKLEFILQELNREFNTIGSKTPDMTIGRKTVEAKTILEELREQVQNIE